MKKASKFLALILAIVTLLTSTVIVSFADFEDELYESGDYMYYIISKKDKTCGLFLYSGESTDVVIPTKLNGYTVIELDPTLNRGGTVKNYKVKSDNKIFTVVNGVAFSKDKKTLVLYPSGKTSTTYSIPKTTKEIGAAAFYGCANLKSVTIPSSVTYIGPSAFNSCEALKSITIPDSVKTIEFATFFQCVNLTKVDLGTGVRKIDDWAFCYCDNLSEITIPANVSYIGESAVNCSTIKGYKGTYAEKYAKNNEWQTFEAIGKIPTSKTGLYKVGETWCYVKSGAVNYKYTGLCKYNGKWYYVNDGVKDASFTGLVKYSGKWYYVKKGVVDFTYTGLVKHSGKWYYVKSGVVNFSYTGLCKYSGKWYYVKKGVVDFKYTGNVKYNGKTYKVVKGVKV